LLLRSMSLSPLLTILQVPRTTLAATPALFAPLCVAPCRSTSILTTIPQPRTDRVGWTRQPSPPFIRIMKRRQKPFQTPRHHQPTTTRNRFCLRWKCHLQPLLSLLNRQRTKAANQQL
jgi:hypothetical protein